MKRTAWVVVCALLSACGGDSDPGSMLGPNPVIGYGTLHVTAETTGADLDDSGYTVVGSWGTQAIEAQGDVSIVHGPAGRQVMGVCVLALHWHVVSASGAIAVVTVPINGTASVPFHVTCLEKGSLRVHATTTGTNLPPYLFAAVSVDGNFLGPLEVPLNGTSPAYRMAPGNVNVSVSAASSSNNCTQARKQIELPPGGDVTVDVAITCH